MSSLAHRQQKIQEKRKQTPWREFLLEIASRCPLMLYKVKEHIMRYPDTSRIKKLLTIQEFTDAGNMMSHDIKYNKQETFFSLIEELKENVGFPYLWKFGMTENCDFADTIGYGSKNCYLTICAGEDIENILYSFYIITKCTNVLNSIGVTNGSQNIYEGVGIVQSFAVFYSKNIINSANIRFCSNLQGCTECLFCNGLANQSYCIHNKNYTKEEYSSKKHKFLNQKENFCFWYNQIIKEGSQLRCVKSSGSFLTDCELVNNGLFVQGVKGGRNLIVVGNGDPIEHCYDNITSATRVEHSYANMGCSPGQHVYCNINGGGSGCSDMYYTMYCLDSHHLLGCIGLKNKSYCILNKQYTKEERYEKVDDIFAQMDADGTLGQFFPATMNPFYFNDTAAYLIDPTFTKEEVTAKGYLRRDEPIKVDIPAGVQTVKTSELGQYEGRRPHPSPSLSGRQALPTGEGDSPVGQRGEPEGGQHRRIDPEIMKKVIIDEEGNAYRIIPMEYEFLMKHGLPLPRKHWLERMKENFKIS